MTNETPNTKPRRRWYQFSLRTLLIVVTVSTVPLGWVDWKLEQGRRQRAVIRIVEEMDGLVGFENVTVEKRWWREWVDTWADKLEEWTERWWSEEKVVSVNLANTQMSDLSPLAELKSLEVLILNDTKVSDLSPLAELENLETLWIFNTQVHDLSPLAESKNLKVLWLDSTHVSEEQAEKLQQALPDCWIVHESLDEELTNETRKTESWFPDLPTSIINLPTSIITPCLN